MKSPISLIEPWFHYLATKTRYISTGSLLNFSNLQKVSTLFNFSKRKFQES